MSDERRKILDMLAQEKINVDEAERLLAALENLQHATNLSPVPLSKGKSRYLRVTVDDKASGQDTQVDIRVPLQLLRAGIKLGSLIPKDARQKMDLAFDEKGFNLDLNNVKPENIEELIEGLSDLTVNVDDAGTKVRIFCE